MVKPMKASRATPLGELAYERLHSAIQAGTLAPGKRMMETEVADWLKMSRTPAREAMRRLETEGLLVHEPPRPHDGHAIAGFFDLGEHVRREDDGPAGAAGLAHQVEDLGPRGGIEVGGGLVEDHQRRVDGQDHGERQLLPHPGAHPRHLPAAVEVEAPRDPHRVGVPAVGAEAGEEAEHPVAVHAAEEPCLPGEIGGRRPHGAEVLERRSRPLGVGPSIDAVSRACIESLVPYTLTFSLFLIIKP